METQAVVVGDVWPSLCCKTIADCFGLKTEPELFIWTLDGSVAAAESRQNRACLAFEASALAPFTYGKKSLAVTATNHITDFHDAGVAATLEALRQHGIHQNGAGLNQKQAELPTTIEIAERRLIVLSFAETATRVGAIAATTTKAGVRPLERESCLRAISDARQKADWVWVILHWGTEFIRYPDPEQRKIAHEMVAAGASLVVGSHAHVALGYEKVNKGWIFYGLGNFLFPSFEEWRGYRYRWHPSARQGTAIIGRLTNGDWDWDAIGIHQDAKGLPHRTMSVRCPDYSVELPTDPTEYLKMYDKLKQREHRQYCCERLMFMTWKERAFRLKSLFCR